MNTEERIKMDTVQKLKNLKLDCSIDGENYRKIYKEISTLYYSHNKQPKQHKDQTLFTIITFIIMTLVIVGVYLLFKYADWSGVPPYDGERDQDDYYQFITK